MRWRIEGEEAVMWWWWGRQRPFSPLPSEGVQRAARKGFKPAASEPCTARLMNRRSPASGGLIRSVERSRCCGTTGNGAVGVRYSPSAIAVFDAIRALCGRPTRQTSLVSVTVARVTAWGAKLTFKVAPAGPQNTQSAVLYMGSPQAAHLAASFLKRDFLKK